MGFSRQEYWSGLPFPSPGDRPNPGIELVSPVSPALQMDSLPAEPLGLQLKKIKKQHLSTSGCCFGFSCSAKSKSVTSQTVARQAPLSMAFPRQEYWSGLSFPSPGDLPDSGIEPRSPALAGRFFTTEPPGKPTGLLGSHPAYHPGLSTHPVCLWPPGLALSP